MEIAFTDSHHLRLSLETSKARRMNHPCPVAFVWIADIVRSANAVVVPPDVKKGRIDCATRSKAC